MTDDAEPDPREWIDPHGLHDPDLVDALIDRVKGIAPDDRDHSRKAAEWENPEADEQLTSATALQFYRHLVQGGVAYDGETVNGRRSQGLDALSDQIEDLLRLEAEDIEF